MDGLIFAELVDPNVKIDSGDEHFFLAGLGDSKVT